MNQKIKGTVKCEFEGVSPEFIVLKNTEKVLEFDEKIKL